MPSLRVIKKVPKIFGLYIQCIYLYAIKQITMTQQQVNQLATITTRYNTLRIAADEAEKAIRNVKFELFTDFLSKEEMDIIEKARHIMCHISGNTHQSDAVKYFNKIQQEENAKETTPETL